MDEITALKKELEEKDKYLILAAQYGKDLLEQNGELHTKMEMLIQEHERRLEKLEQDRYSLSMKLEAKERTLNSVTSELEMQEKLHKEAIQKLTEETDRENLKINKKNSAYETKVETLEEEIHFLKEQLQDMKNLLDQFQQQQHEASQLNLTDNFECMSQLQHQVNCLSLEKQDLEKDLLDLKSIVKSSTLNLKRRDDELQTLRSELEEKECQLTSIHNEVERSKNEIEELNIEIDQIRFDETDVKRKGNSLFAELEDNRQALEKHVITLNSKLSTFKKQCEIKSQQIKKLKLHVASLLSMTTNATDLQYQKHLEDSLGVARSQLNVTTNQCREMEERLKKLEQQNGNHNVMETLDKQSANNYIKYLYDESQGKVKELEEKLRATCFVKVSLSDENLQLKRKLHQSEKYREANNSEVLRLNVKIEELMSSKGISNASICTESESPAEEVEFYYEKLEPKTTEASKEDSVSKCKEPLKEIINTENESSSITGIKKEIKEELPQEKENRFCSIAELSNSKYVKKREKKGVAFSLDVKEECEKPQKLEKLVKTRRKMEAPIIRENPDSQDCKVQ